MKYRHILSLVVAAAFLMVSRVSTQAAVVLTSGSNVYTYQVDYVSRVDDPNAVKVGATLSNNYGTEGFTETSAPTAGTVTYTFTTPETFDTLNLNYQEQFYFSGTNSITGTYDIGAGPVTFSTHTQPASGWIDPVDNYTITNINGSSVTVTWTLSASGDRGFAVLFPDHGDFTAPSLNGLFTATATFVPEPASAIGLIGMLGLFFCSRRRK